MAVEQLADELGLSAPTVAHHLKRLRAAGLVVARPRPPHVEYALRLDRLVAIPASDKKRQVILRYLLERCFPEDREYGEREVTERLAEVHAEDPVTLRRALVDSGLPTRSAGVYRRG